MRETPKTIQECDRKVIDKSNLPSVTNCISDEMSGRKHVLRSFEISAPSFRLTRTGMRAAATVSVLCRFPAGSATWMVHSSSRLV